MPESKLFLIDAHALCYRSYFAIKGLATSYGQATNAVYGFANTLKKILREYKPEYLAVCFDAGKKTHRQEKFAEYKINRPSMPDDLISQLPLIKEVVAAYNLPLFEMEGFEADDIIATLTSKASKENLDVVIVSDDKDMFQLIGDHVRIFSSRNDALIGPDEARQRFGIDPLRITDYIALAGDKTDNIPGVAGVGEVTARTLINEFGTLENLLKNVDKISSEKLREKIREQKEAAIFSKELAVLDASVPVSFDLKVLRVQEPDSSQLSELFRRLEFRRLAEEYSPEPQVADQPIETKKAVGEDLKDFLTKSEKDKIAAFLPEAADESGDGQIRRMFAATKDGSVYDISLDDERVRSSCRKIWENPAIIKVTHDIKNVRKVLAEKGEEVKGEVFDLLLAGYLLAPSQGNFDIGTLAWGYLQNSSGLLNQPSRAVSMLIALYGKIKEELKQKDLLKLFNEIEMPLSYVLFKMESAGVSIDEKFLADMSVDCDKRISALLKDIYRLAGEEINLNSPKQLSRLLFEKLKLPAVKKTKTGFSTNESVLVKLADKHPAINKILEYRQLAKLKSTYIDALPKLINRRSGKIHASFNQVGTETGRLSSNNPNLQNIPIRTELGQQIRRAFVPKSKDRWIISADYSQIELRILGHLAQDKNLLKAFKQDEDIHTFTAALIFDVKEKNVTAHMRNAAKRVNFGIIYGMSAFGLAKDLNVPQQEAQEFIDKYFLRYPGVKKFMDNEIAKAEKNGYVLTLLNRRRYIPEINSDNMAVQQFAQRQAINTPVQGSAADLMKLAMINIQNAMEKQKMDSRMIITVHDELVFDVAADEKESLVAIVRKEMENCMKLSVPIKVSIKAGKNWLETKEV